MQTSCWALATAIALSIPSSAFGADQQNGDPQSETQPNPIEDQTPNNDDLTPEQMEDEIYGDVIVVTGVTNPVETGAVIGDIEPEVQYDTRQIRALGVSTLSDVLAEIAPQTTSGQGRGDEGPVILVNGRRIGSFREIRSYPPEAVTRIDVLPEEVALKYGYSANQKVVNFVLRPRFNAITAELNGGLVTQGGQNDQKASVNYLTIRQENRLSFDAEYSRSSSLLESERDIISRNPSNLFAIPGNITSPISGAEIDPGLSVLAGTPVTIAPLPANAQLGAPALSDFVANANQPVAGDDTGFRTLIPKTESLSLGASIARPLSGTTVISGNLGFTANESESLLGLPNSTLLVDADNPFSPFSDDVLVLRQVDGLGPLTRNSENRSFEAAVNLLGNIGEWRWNFTGNYAHGENETLTQRSLDQSALEALIAANDPAVNPFAPINTSLLAWGPDDRSYSNTEDLKGEGTIGGSLFMLPAGEVNTTIKAGARYQHIDSQFDRNNISSASSLSRTTGSLQANFDLPIADEKADVLGALGKLTLNGNVAVDELSDAGTLFTYGGGLSWQPMDQLRFIASFTREEGAPSIEQLGNPQIATPNVRVIDFVNSESVEITQVTGGNPLLTPDDRRVIKLGLTANPFEDIDLSFTANYTDSRIDNPVASFPVVTAEIEQAFPNRFVRDQDGRLLQIDARPLNFEKSSRKELRWGINFSHSLDQAADDLSDDRRRERQYDRELRREEASQQNSEADDAASSETDQTTDEGGVGQTTREQITEEVRGDRARGEGAREGGGAGRAGGGRGGRGGGAQGSRIQLGIYHNWRFEDRITVADGVPELDLLNGSAIGNSGGQPRHEIEGQLGFSKDGFGVRSNITWLSGTKVLVDRTNSVGSPDDLFFSPQTTVDLRFFVDFSLQRKLVEDVPFLRGSRLSLEFDNIFDSRPEIRDGTGATPIAYQPDLLDPRGRSVSLTFRKLFF